MWKKSSSVVDKALQQWQEVFGKQEMTFVNCHIRQFYENLRLA